MEERRRSGRKISVARGIRAGVGSLIAVACVAIVVGWQQVQPSETGSVIYSGHGCAGCHGEEGGGGIGPQLAGNPKLLNPDYVVDQILLGGGGMPAFEQQLSSSQIARVATHVRTSWGNDLAEIGEEFIEQRRSLVVVDEASAASGSQLFAWNCMICHGVNGGGGVGPPLAGNPHLADINFVVAQIQLGGGGMPPLAPILESAEVARVASYIRTAWGNDFGEVEADHVRLQWQGLAGGNDPAQQQVASGGEQLYSSLGCAGCHSSEGAGGIGPPLDGNPALADAAYVVTTIRDGRDGMPSFGDQLDERGLAQLASYVRTAWTNEFGIVDLEPLESLPESLRRSQADPLAFESLAAAGEQLYKQMGCAGCHSSRGAGGIGPPLDGNGQLSDPRFVVDTILSGAEQMPAFGPLMTDEQIAAVATHIRTAWRNDFGPIAVDEVTRLRPALKSD